MFSVGIVSYKPAPVYQPRWTLLNSLTSTDVGQAAYDPVTNSIWVYSSGTTIRKINATTGSYVDFPCLGNILDLIYDPVTSSIWALHSAGAYAGSMSKFDPTTGAYTSISNAQIGSPYSVYCFDWNPVNETLCILCGGYALKQYSVANGTVTSYFVDSHGAGYSRLACDAAGNIWVSWGNSVSYGVDKYTSNMTFLGTSATGPQPHFVVYDPITDSIWVNSATGTALTKVSVQTGAVQSVNVGASTNIPVIDTVGHALYLKYGSAYLARVDLVSLAITSGPLIGTYGGAGLVYLPDEHALWYAHTTLVYNKISTD